MEKEKDYVMLNIRLLKTLRREIKRYAVEKEISIREFVIKTLEKELRGEQWIK